MQKILTQDISLPDVQENFVGDVSKSLVKCYNERDVKNVSQRDVFVFAVHAVRSQLKNPVLWGHSWETQSFEVITFRPNILVPLEFQFYAHGLISGVFDAEA